MREADMAAEEASWLPQSGKFKGYVVIAVAFSGLVAFPWIGDGYSTTLMLSAFGFAIALFGLNLLFGYSGLLSLGHALFLAIGAYTAAYLQKRGIFHIEVILAVAVAVAFVVAIGVGLVCVRYVKIYFTMLTFAFSMLFYSFLYKFYSLTGGDEGIRVSRPRLLGQDLSDLDSLSYLTGPFYYYALALLLVLTILMTCIVRSPLGLYLRAMRENPQKAASLGVSIHVFRLIAFVIAAMYGAIGGVIITVPVGLADPTLAYWLQSGNLIFMLLLGGYTNFFGPVVGAIVFIFLQDQLMSVTEYWRFTFGILLAVIVIFFPRGLMALIDRTSRWST